MKRIKKVSGFSTPTDLLNESSKVNQDAVMDLVKKMGYDNIEELKKEKNLLSKLEAILKDFTPKEDISEDEIGEDRTEEIEDENIEDSKTKSLEGEEGEIEEGDYEDEEEGDYEEEDEEEDEFGIDVEEEEDTPVATRRIMAFEDFIKEREATVNKNEEEEDESRVNEAVNASAYIKVGKLTHRDQFLGRQSLSKTLSLDLGLNPRDEFTGPWIGFDNVSMYALGKNGGTILGDALSRKYTYDELKTTAANFLGISVVKESVIFEKKIKSDKEFEEYATEILKSAHGDKFDEAKAKEVIDGLKSKYSGDYGAMVGALQSSMG